MQHDNVTLEELESNLVDINRDDLIPKIVIDALWDWKKNQGGIPTGISHIPEKGWYLISPALQGKGIIKYFSDDTR